MKKAFKSKSLEYNTTSLLKHVTEEEMSTNSNIQTIFNEIGS